MSLTRIPKSNQGTISTYQLLLEIASSLSVLVKDPKSLEKAADEAYKAALTSEEQAAAANENIIKANAMLKEADQRIALAEKSEQNAQDLLNVAKEASDKANSDLSQVNKLKLLLDQKQIELVDYESKLNSKEKELSLLKDKLDADTAKLEERVANVKNMERDLQGKMEKLQSIIG